MPRRDGAGPDGKGPTGKGLGPCGPSDKNKAGNKGTKQESVKATPSKKIPLKKEKK